jgi:hypothetical protein
VKITPEEKRLLVQFAGFAAIALGLPRSRSSMGTMVYLVEKFEQSYNKNADLMRKPKSAEVLAELAKRNGNEDVLARGVRFDEGILSKPVNSCATRNYPHDHVLCEVRRG